MNTRMPPDARKTRRSPTEPYFRAGQVRTVDDLSGALQTASQKGKPKQARPRRGTRARGDAGTDRHRSGRVPAPQASLTDPSTPAVRKIGIFPNVNLSATVQGSQCNRVFERHSMAEAAQA